VTFPNGGAPATRTWTETATEAVADAAERAEAARARVARARLAWEHLVPNLTKDYAALKRSAELLSRAVIDERA
jgi:hypothetical protein